VYAALLLSCASDAAEGPAESRNDAGKVAAQSSALSVETPVLPVADTYVRKWTEDTNYGSASELEVEGTIQSAYKHGLVRFDAAAIAAAVGTDALEKAELELTIAAAPGFYGDGTISVHRMTMPWTELGATWDCANDTATWNTWTDCSFADRWGMEWGDPFPVPYVLDASDARYVAALQTGTIRLDVTEDVQAILAQPSANRGWLIKAGNDPYLVFVRFGSRESTSDPRLILTHAQSCPDHPSSGLPGQCGCALRDDVCNGYDGDCDGRVDEGYQATCQGSALAVCVSGAIVAAACDDGYVCNGAETCAVGACVPGTPLPVDDGNACTEDSCSLASGVQHTPMPDGAVCNDGNLCTLADTCSVGACSGAARDCSAVADQCNAGVCNPATGECALQPRANGTSCDDRVACTPTDTCQAGACRGSGNTCASPGLGCTFATFDRHSYWFCRTERSWSSARSSCQAVGMDLVAVETQAEDAFVSTLIDRHVWLGGTDAGTQGTWSWAVNSARFWIDGNSGGPINNLYANWENGGPDWGITGDCAAKDATGADQWETFSCSTTVAYVCETAGFGSGEVCDEDSEQAGPPRRDLQCQPGLVCGQANGARFDEPAQAGVCWPPTCENGVKDPTETDVDCGGACGPCTGVCVENFCRQGETVLPAPTEVLAFSSGAFTRSSAATYQAGPDRIEHALPNRLRYEDRGDGHGRVALFEGSRTNVLRFSEAPGETPWTPPTGTPLPMLLTFGTSAPDESTPVAGLLALEGADFSPSQFATAPSGAAMLSVWQRLSPLSVDGSGANRLHVLSSNHATVYGGGQDWELTPHWTRMETATTPTTGAKVVYAHHANFPVVGKRALPEVDFEFWGMQWETGRFPSSYIRTESAAVTRAADQLTYTSGQVPTWLRTGRWQIDVYPEFASNEMDAGRVYTLVSFGGSSSVVALVDGKVRVRVGGSNRLDRDATWKRHQKLTLTIDVGGAAITIRGADTGDGTFPVSAFTFPTGALRIGGVYNASGSEAFARISQPRRVSAAQQACVPSPTHCTAGCPCDEGEGGCTLDSHCRTGLVCTPNAGARHGLPANYGVCEDPGCPDPDFGGAHCGTVDAPCGLCTPVCVPDCSNRSCGSNGCGGSCGAKCGRGEGGAESSADCEPGLVLGVAMGAQFDLPPDMNVCVDPICTQLRDERLPCGTLSDPCGRCPACEPKCDGRLCGDDGCGGQCGTCAVGECGDGGYCVQVASGPVAHLPPAGTDLSNAPVGTLPGNFLVNHAGEATYTVPLGVPPGRGGVQPNIALSYNSNRDNGYVGLGWAVEGFSAIARCNRTVATDGQAAAPELLPSDAFCLDGNRMVPLSIEVVGETSPQFAITYRLESDQYMLIRGYFSASGEALVGPYYFRAWAKDGRIIEYGNSPGDNAVVRGAMRFDVNADVPQITTWLLSRVSDRTDNSMSVQYIHRERVTSSRFAPREVEFYPRAITYGPAESPIAVQFVYDFDNPSPPALRGDHRSAWRNGTKVHVDQLLQSVDVQLNGALIRRYKLAYDAGTNLGEAMLLDNVQQCDQDNVCLPPTRFVYDEPVTPRTPALTPLPDPVEPGSDVEELVPPGADYGYQTRVGRPLDMNGDGIDDILYQVVSYYNDEEAPDQQRDFVALMSNGEIGEASHVYVHTQVTSDFRWRWTTGPFGWFGVDQEDQIRTVDGGSLGSVDYNNDGRMDVLTATFIRETGSSNYRVLTFNGTSFSYLDLGIFYDIRRPGEVFIADADGDGYQDMVRCMPKISKGTSNEWFVYYNVEGRGFSEATKVVLQSDAPCAKDSLAIDANGDGRDEILIKVEPVDPTVTIGGAAAPMPSTLMYIERDGTVAFQSTYAELGDRAGLYSAGPRTRLIDINGDGLSDVLGWSIELEASFVDISISISRGDGTFDVHRQRLNFGTTNRDTMLAMGMSLGEVVDVDRDGKQDLIATSRAGGPDTFFSNGEGFEPGVLLNLWGKDVRDYDRDGFKEPGMIVGGEPKPKLRRVTDGYGAVTSVTYGLLSDPELHDEDLYEPDGTTFCDYPFLCRVHTGSVVALHGIDEGVGGRKAWEHHYEGARTAALRRGFQGFLGRSIDERTQTEDISTTRYSYNNRTRNDLNAFPFAFLPFAKVQVTHLPDGDYVQNEHRTYVSTFPIREMLQGRVYGTDVAVPTLITRDRYTISNRGFNLLSHEADEILEHDPLFGNVLVRKQTLSDQETRFVTVQYKHDVNSDFADAWLIDLPAVVEDRYVFAGKQEIAKRTDLDYYDNGKLLSRIEDTGLIATYTYNDHGGLETESQGSFDDGIRERTITWDAFDEYPIEVTNSLGHETEMEYDRRFGVVAWSEDPNDLLTVRGHDNFGRLKAVFSPTGASTTLSYHPGTSTLPLVVDRRDGTGARQITRYDAGGRPTEETSFDFTGQELLQSVWYDPRGRVFARTLPTAPTAGAPAIVATYTYDNLDRVTSEVGSDGTTRGCYQDNVACIQNGRGATRCSVRDDRGRVVRVTDPVEMTCEAGLAQWPFLRGLTYTYQAFDVLHQVFDQEGNASTITVDAHGRKTNSVDPDRGSESFVYSAFGEVRQYTNGEGEVSSFTFDSLGRMIQRRDWSGAPDMSSFASTTWEWDGGATRDPGELLGALTQTVSPDGYAVDYRYDSRGLPETETLTGGGESYTTTRTWDDFGRPRTIAHPQKDGVPLFVAQFEYAAPTTQSGALRRVFNGGDAAWGSEQYWLATTADTHGRLTGETMGNGSQRIRSWYASGRLRTMRTLRADLSELQDLEYLYDGVGNLETQIDGVNSRTDTFVYDAFDRLLEEQTANPRSYTYDTLGNLQQAGFAFDNDQPRAISADGTFTYEYDDAGRRTSKLRSNGSGLAIDYTRFGLPQELRTLGIGGATTATTSLDYDADGRRVRKVTADGGRVYTPGFERQTYTDGRPSEHFFYVSNGTEIVAQVKAVVGGARSTTYLHASHVGTTSVIEQGTTVTQVVHDAFGRPISTTGQTNPWNAPSTVGFGGHEMDPEVELVNMAGRMYDPATRQFLTPDPVIAAPFSPTDLHPYNYAWSNPLRFVDPTGLREGERCEGSCEFDDHHVGGEIWGDDEGSIITVETGDDRADGDPFSSPLGSFGFGDRDGFDSFAGEAPGGPDWLEGQVENAAWFGLGAAAGVGAGTVIAAGAAALAATAAGPAILVGLAVVGTAAAISSYDYDAIVEWGSKFYGNELSVSQLLSGGFVVGTALSGLRGLGRAPRGPAPRVAAPLAEVLEGHGAGQGFTGVFDTASGRVLIRPSTGDSAVPAGWVARRGGHADVSAALGGDAAEHVGFAAILEEGGTLRLTWRSGTLNPAPNYVVPAAMRPAIVEAIQRATGRAVSAF
jgi:RHS repeat-associated protein